MPLYIYIIKTEENNKAELIIMFPKLIIPQTITNFK